MIKYNELIGHNHSWEIIMQSWYWILDPALMSEGGGTLPDHDSSVLHYLFLIELMSKISIRIKIL